MKSLLKPILSLVFITFYTITAPQIPPNYFAFPLIYSNEQGILYADPQRAKHCIAVSGSEQHSPLILAQLCNVIQKSVATDCSLLIDQYSPTQACSLCKKIGLVVDHAHIHVALGNHLSATPAQGPCEFCEVIEGTRQPGRNQDGRVVATSDKAMLFTKDGKDTVINNCLAVPTSHIVNVQHMTDTDISVVAALFALIKDTMHNVAPQSPYVLVTNSGAQSPCRQSVFHMHVHIESPGNCRFTPEILR